MNDYARQQMQRDREHEKNLLAQYKKLTPAEQKVWREQGLIELPDDFNTGRGKDVTERIDLAEAEPESCTPEIEQPEGSAEVEAYIMQRLAEGYRRLAGELLADNNRDLAVESLSVALRLSYEGCSQTDIAKRHGVNKAAVSKRAVFWTNLFGLKTPVEPMRKRVHRKTYAKRATVIHYPTNESLIHRIRVSAVR